MSETISDRSDVQEWVNEETALGVLQQQEIDRYSRSLSFQPLFPLAPLSSQGGS